MKIIPQSFEIMDDLDGQAILKKLERCGRICYKSEKAITDESAERFVRNLIKSGHESVLEHISFTVRFVTDRGITHEIVRHRLASYSQESTRYVKHNDDMEFIEPIKMNADEDVDFVAACKYAELKYCDMIIHGASPQVARDVLPTAVKTEIVMSANLREWRHFFKLRVQGTTGEPHPKIRALCAPLLAQLKQIIPVVFDDIEVKKS